MDDNTLAIEHDGGFAMNGFGQPHDDSKSLRVQGSLALQACSLLTTKQFKTPALLYCRPRRNDSVEDS